jgi:hypothetical protein
MEEMEDTNATPEPVCPSHQSKIDDDTDGTIMMVLMTILT